MHHKTAPCPGRCLAILAMVPCRLRPRREENADLKFSGALSETDQNSKKIKAKLK